MAANENALTQPLFELGILHQNGVEFCHKWEIGWEQIELWQENICELQILSKIVDSFIRKQGLSDIFILTYISFIRKSNEGTLVEHQYKICG